MCTQEGGEFIPVKVDREILKSIPKSEVIIKNWGPRGGNQYYKLLLPEVQITLCKQCQQVSNSSCFVLYSGKVAGAKFSQFSLV